MTGVPAEAYHELWRFTVPGKPVGFYVLGARPDWKRKKAYHEYLRHVRRCAAEAGVDLDQISATKDRPLVVVTEAYFLNGHHPDPENVRKAVCDAIFYRPRGRGRGTADKYCGGRFTPPLYDHDNPRVEVFLEAPGFWPSLASPGLRDPVCGAGAEDGPLGEPVRCILGEGHTGDHEARSGSLTFAWKQ